MDACQTYVSMLQARRAEEEASRSARKQRRADIVAKTLDGFKKRSVAARRRVMDEKLHNMVSSKEQEIFSMLSDQTKWRHVMQENIVNREKQHADAARLHSDLHETELELKREQEQQLYKDVVRDDKTRFAEAVTEKKSKHKRETEALCRNVVEDILRAVNGVASFIEEYNLLGTAEKAPATVISDYVRSASFPHDPAQGNTSLVERHVTGQLYGELLGADGSSRLFVSLVRKMLLLKFPKPPSFKPSNPSPKPVVVLAGAKYAGKTFVGKAIAASLGLVLVSDMELINAAIQEFERDLTSADFSNAEAVELLDLGREVRQTLLDGASVSPALLSKLVLHKLKFLPPDATGILLDGLPSSVEGFEKLEEALSGYDKCRSTTVPEVLLAPLMEGINPDDPVLNVERIDTTTTAPEASTTVVKKEAAAKAKGKKGKDEHEEPLPPIDLPVVDPIPPLTEEEAEAIACSTADVDESAIHAVVHLQCSPEEIFKRFAGLRIDSETGRIYHMEQDPPPKERLPFIQSRDRTEALTAKLYDAVEHHDNTWAECVQWLSRYDNVLSEVNASTSDVDSIVSKATDLVNAAKERASLYFYRHQLAKEAVARQEEFRKLHEERMANRDAARRQLAAIYLERGVDVLPPELQEPPKEIAPESLIVAIPPQLPSLFLANIDHFQSHYSKTISTAHGQLSHLVKQLYTHGNSCCAAVDGLWCQPDAKQKQLDQFVEEFNTMIPALRRDPQGKDELHLRIDSLGEALYTVVDKRREECNNLIDALNYRTTFTDSWTDCVRAVGAMLVQGETERFLLVKQLAVLYFSALRGEPVQIEDHADLDIVPTVKPLVIDVVTVDAKAAGGKDKKPPPKKGQKADEGTEKPTEDIFTPAVERSLAGMKAVVERMMPSAAQTTASKGPAKDAKKGALDSVPNDNQSILLLAVPLLQAEFECAKRRVHNIVQFVNDFIAKGIDHNNNVRKKLLADLRKAQIRQMRAVNSALFDLRCAVEEERPVLFQLVLGLDTYAVDTNVVLATTVNAVLSGTPFAGISPPSTKDVQLLPTLAYSRLKALVKALRAVAPTYVLYKEDFMQLVSASDYSSAGPTVASLEAVFSRFDSQSCGAIDWREFIVHILLWCEPVVSARFGESSSHDAQFAIDGPSLVQLFEFRADIGSDLLRHDEFIDVPFFFEGSMSEERLEAYLEVLWDTFVVGDTVDPNVLVLFLCADEQPLRGLQKAFAMGAPAGDESCAVTLDAMYGIFHVKANSSSKMQMIDPYCRETLQSLYSSASSLSFQDVCLMHVGRVLLNSSDMFQRKTFV